MRELEQKIGLNYSQREEADRPTDQASLKGFVKGKQKEKRIICSFFKKMGQPRPLLSFIFGLFKQTSLQCLQQIYVKYVHPVYGAVIQTFGT